MSHQKAKIQNLVILVIHPIYHFIVVLVIAKGELLSPLESLLFSCSHVSF